jgi:hypothetical protein
VENTYISQTTSFDLEGDQIGHMKLFNPATFYLSAWTRKKGGRVFVS